MAGSRLLEEEASLPVIRWLFEIVREKTDVIWYIKITDLHLNGSILNNSRLGFQESPSCCTMERHTVVYSKYKSKRVSRAAASQQHFTQATTRYVQKFVGTDLRKVPGLLGAYA